MRQRGKQETAGSGENVSVVLPPPPPHGRNNLWVSIFNIMQVAHGLFIVHRSSFNDEKVKAYPVTRHGSLAIPFTPLCQCLSDETVKAVGPFYLVSMPGDVKDPTSPHWSV